MSSKTINKNNTTYSYIVTGIDIDIDNKNKSAEFTIVLKTEGSTLIAGITFENRSNFTKEFPDKNILVNKLYSEARNHIIEHFLDKNKTVKRLKIADDNPNPYQILLNEQLNKMVAILRSQ